MPSAFYAQARRRSSHRSAAVLPLLMVGLLLPGPVAAQPGLEKIVDRDETGASITATGVEATVIGRIARAAGVPMGIEIARGKAPRSRARTLTGLTVHAALDILTSMDSRYEWRDMNGVIVLRTPEEWNSAQHPLQLPIQPVVLRDIRARNLLSIVAAFLGGPQYRDTQLSDTRRFSVSLEQGTVLDLLNAAVSAHGDLAWSFEAIERTASFPFVVSIHSGASGNGCGVPGRPPDAPVNVARYLDPPALAVGGSSAVLDRIVGVGPNELPLVVNGPSPWAVHQLANATRIPMGLEFLAPGKRPLTAEIPASGRPLRDVLDAMIAVNPQYEWREMDGVVVIRPVAAWNDSQSLLFRIVPPVRMIEVTLQEAVQRLAREVGYPHAVGEIAAGRRLSLDLPQGSVLDLVNAIVRAHGELTWTLEPEPPLDGARAGFRYTLVIGVMGGLGLGFGVR